MKNQTVPYEGMKAIYDVACESWKKKIKEMTSLFEDTTLTEKQITEMFDAADVKQKKVLEKYLKEPGNRISNWLDILDYHGVREFEVPYKNPKTSQERQLNATVYASKIAEAFNDGKALTWENREEFKYMPYKYYTGGSWSVVFDYYYDCACCPVGLCFTTAKDALRAYELFPEIYDDYYMFNF